MCLEGKICEYTGRPKKISSMCLFTHLPDWPELIQSIFAWKSCNKNSESSLVRRLIFVDGFGFLLLEHNQCPETNQKCDKLPWFLGVIKRKVFEQKTWKKKVGSRTVWWLVNIPWVAVEAKRADLYSTI